MKSKLTLIKMYVKPEEKAQIAGNAKACRLSMSGYARTLALGEKPTSNLDIDAMHHIVKVASDLGRLGGLLKMFLTNDERLNDIGREMGVATIDGVLVDIRITQARLMELVDAFVRKAKRGD
jgi:hypothetical protein